MLYGTTTLPEGEIEPPAPAEAVMVGFTRCTMAAADVCPSGFVIVMVYFSAPTLGVASVVLRTRLTVVGFT